MDAFIDKLSERKNAQSMIDANRAADAKELEDLRTRNAEYERMFQEMSDSCERLKELTLRLEQEKEQESARWQAEKEEFKNRLTQEVRSSLEELKKTSDQNNAALLEHLENSAKDSMVDAEGLNQLIEESLKSMKKVHQGQEAWSDVKTGLEDGIEQLEDYVHRENVKVYRNVQAVVTEESEKQKTALEEVSAKTLPRLKAVQGLSITALILGILGIALQLVLHFIL